MVLESCLAFRCFVFAREDGYKSRREVVDETELAKGIIVPKIASQPPGMEGYEAYASIVLMKYP